LNVFPTPRAEITRTVKTNLPAGKNYSIKLLISEGLHKIVITDLSHQAHDVNFRVGGKKGFLLDAICTHHEESIPRVIDPKKVERQKAKKEKLEQLEKLSNQLRIDANDNRVKRIKVLVLRFRHNKLG
jgi:hypothetical protein